MEEGDEERPSSYAQMFWIWRRNPPITQLCSSRLPTAGPLVAADRVVRLLLCRTSTCILGIICIILYL